RAQSCWSRDLHSPRTCCARNSLGRESVSIVRSINKLICLQNEYFSRNGGFPTISSLVIIPCCSIVTFSRSVGCPQAQGICPYGASEAGDLQSSGVSIHG